MTTSRRDMLRAVGLAAIGGVLAPGRAGADRLRILTVRDQVLHLAVV